MKIMESQKQESLAINKDSERYRQCPWCKTEFMATHLAREFCCPEHKDSYHNHDKRQRKRLMMHALAAQKSHSLSISDNPHESKALENNIALLKMLPLESNGSVYLLAELASKGFAFEACSFNYKLCNTDNSYCVVYGNFETYLIAPDRILIHRKNS